MWQFLPGNYPITIKYYGVTLYSSLRKDIVRKEACRENLLDIPGKFAKLHGVSAKIVVN